MKVRGDLYSIAWKSICEEIHGRSMTKKEVAEVWKQSNYWKCIKGIKECHEYQYGSSYCCWDCEKRYRKGSGSISKEIYTLCVAGNEIFHDGILQC